MMQSKENLFAYYQQELEFLKKFSKKFAHAHPAEAGNLISNDYNIDPFTDRLIEAIGLLNARNHFTLDAEFSDMCAALLECIAPQSLAPIPAMSIVQFTPQAIKSVVNIPRKTVLTSMTPTGEICCFTTGYNVECQPFNIAQVNLSTDRPKLFTRLKLSHTYKSYLRIKLENAETINFNHLRFFIRAQPPYAYMFYELLFKHSFKVILADSLDDKNPLVLDKNHIKSEGFDAEQSLLFHHNLQNREQILLSEFFNCPEKFLFFSIHQPEAEKKFNSHSAYIFILFDAVNDELEKHLAPDFLALNCTPIVNIFPALSEPIHINHTQNEYLLKARLNHHPLATEIYSIQEISAYNTEYQQILFHPRYYPTSNIYHSYHTIHRSSSQREIWLAFSTNYPELFYQQEWIASAKILCTNRHLATQLPYGGNLPHFYFDEKKFQTDISNIKILIPFTQIQDVSLDHESIIGKLLSYLFIYQSPRDFLNFQRTVELLSSKNNDSHSFLNAITHLNYYSTQSRVDTKNIVHSIINGTDITIEMDIEKISPSQIFFFCSILERHFAFQAEINTYTSLVLINNQQEEIYRWPLRCGETEFAVK